MILKFVQQVRVPNFLKLTLRRSSVYDAEKRQIDVLLAIRFLSIIVNSRLLVASPVFLVTQRSSL